NTSDDNTPLQPAEWEHQVAVWTAWPRLVDEWGPVFPEVKRELAAFLLALAQRVPVRALVHSPAVRADAEGVVSQVGRGADDHASDLEFVEGPYGDIWLRDTGP